MSKFEEDIIIDHLGQLNKYLGVWWSWHKNNDGEIYLKYEEMTNREARKFQSPGYPGKELTKNPHGPTNIDEYQSIIKQLLYFATQIAPNMSNAIQDLFLHILNPRREHWKTIA